MNYYIDIKINPDTDMREDQLMGVIYTKFHKALVNMKTDRIGVSFPKFNYKLGSVLRIHGDKTDLISLQNFNWMGGLTRYCNVGEIELVPTEVKYRTISRIRPRMAMARLRRLKSRGSISVEREKEYIAKMMGQGLSEPYLDLKSDSTAQIYRRFFKFGSVLDNPVVGKYDSYGLSKIATIPWF